MITDLKKDEVSMSGKILEESLTIHKHICDIPLEDITRIRATLGTGLVLANSLEAYISFFQNRNPEEHLELFEKIGTCKDDLYYLMAKCNKVKAAATELYSMLVDVDYDYSHEYAEKKLHDILERAENDSKN